MRELNLGVHRLSPGGYRVEDPKWDKEDAERAAQGLPPLFKKYGDKPTDNYVRARYKSNPITGELTTDPKVQELERLLVKNTSPCLISVTTQTQFKFHDVFLLCPMTSKLGMMLVDVIPCGDFKCHWVLNSFELVFNANKWAKERC